MGRFDVGRSETAKILVTLVIDEDQDEVRRPLLAAGLCMVPPEQQEQQDG